MKKVYTTIFLFISLFFFSSSGVKADTIDIGIDGFITNTINENIELYIEKANNTLTESGYNYYFIYRTGSLFYIYFFNDYNNTFIYSNSRITTTINTIYRLKVNSDNTFSPLANSNTLTVIINNSNYQLIYTNYPFKYNGSNEFKFISGECSYYLNDGDNVLGLYNYYLANQNSCTLESEEEPDIHLEEKEILTNFYTLVIEKINNFTSNIFNNHIYFSVIGIFILLFVIRLIRRLL